jgi:hypothetical protein
MVCRLLEQSDVPFWQAALLMCGSLQHACAWCGGGSNSEHGTGARLVAGNWLYSSCLTSQLQTVALACRAIRLLGHQLESTVVGRHNRQAHWGLFAPQSKSRNAQCAKTTAHHQGQLSVFGSNALVQGFILV